MRNKTRFQYVDEFRKINVLEKLPKVENLHPDEEEDAKQENNKFIRYKEEGFLEYLPHQDDYLYNRIVSSYQADVEEECTREFSAHSQDITADIQHFRQWSQSLNQQIKSKDYRHRFYFQEATPPPRLKDEYLRENSARSSEEVVNGKNEQAEDTNLELPQRGKYNFHEITRHLYTNAGDGDEKDRNVVRDLTIKAEVAELKRLRSLEQIERIGEFNQEFGKFSYYIEAQPDLAEIEYVDNSIVRGNNTLTIDYFRDIGTPSRRILEYTIGKERKMRVREEDEDLQSDYQQENRELLYLYFLKEEELKINKSEMTFFDLANMAMGRITSHNASMCVRNEKVTKAQYAKLLKKMEKYNLRQNEAGKPKEDKEVGTEELEEINAHSKRGQQEVEVKEDRAANLESIIDEINKIRKEVRLIEDSNAPTLCSFNPSNFHNEVYLKLEQLLNTLYDRITDKMTEKYSLSEIGEHLAQMEGANELGYDRLRILWFVANCYDEMISKQEKTVDLRNIGTNKPHPIPQVTKYKGSKVIYKNSIQASGVYRDKDHTTKIINPPNPTPLRTSNRTPLKADLNKSTLAKTPTKNVGNTGSRLSTPQQVTTKKYALTAKK